MKINELDKVTRVRFNALKQKTGVNIAKLQEIALRFGLLHLEKNLENLKGNPFIKLPENE